MQQHAEERCFYDMFNRDEERNLPDLINVELSMFEPDDDVVFDKRSPRYQPRKIRDFKDKTVSTRKTSEFEEEFASIFRHSTDTQEHSVCMFSMQSIMDFKQTEDINKKTDIIDKPGLSSPEDSIVDDVSLCKRESIKSFYPPTNKGKLFYKSSLKKKVKTSKLFWSGKTINYPFVFDKVTKAKDSPTYYYVKDMSKKLISHSRQC